MLAAIAASVSLDCYIACAQQPPPPNAIPPSLGAPATPAAPSAFPAAPISLPAASGPDPGAGLPIIPPLDPTSPATPPPVPVAPQAIGSGAPLTPPSDPFAERGNKSNFGNGPLNAFEAGAGYAAPGASSPDEVKRLESELAAFDNSRADAANAVFRLAECYRRLKRFDEAKVQYARILREFVDFPDLAKPSQKLLAQLGTAVIDATRTSNRMGPLDRLEMGLSGAREVGRSSQNESKLATILDQEMKQEAEIRHLEGIVRLLHDTEKPEALPPSIINDPRYARLKDGFESALGATPAADGSNPADHKEVDRRRAQIAEWLRSIYLPEEENQLKFLAEQRDRLQREEMELQKQLEEVRKTWRMNSPIGGSRSAEGAAIISRGGASSVEAVPPAPNYPPSGSAGPVPPPAIR